MEGPPKPPAASAAYMRLTRIALEHGSMLVPCSRETLTAPSSYLRRKEREPPRLLHLQGGVSGDVSGTVMVRLGEC